MTKAEKVALKRYPTHEGASEQWIKAHINNLSDFIQGYEQAEKETIDYACYQLELRLPEVLNYQGIQVARKDFINDFKEAMLLD